MLADCLQGFGQMLYAALIIHFEECGYYVSDGHYFYPEQRRKEIHYPGAVTTTIQKLMQSSQDCIDFITRLYYRMTILMVPPISSRMITIRV